MSVGTLYICPTPIGNLDDISYRVIKTLKEVDLIAAEDTRHTLKLLNHFEIKNKLVSYHEHNKTTSGPQLIENLLIGQSIALVSDAGMPGISDPGEDLVKLCIEDNIPVVALPGPSAVITALAASGLSTRRFFFEGFLDRQKKVRKERLNQIKNITETIIFYESPHRLKETLKDMELVLGNRHIVIARELTKKYEEYYRGHINDALSYFEAKEVKGEFVLILEGGEEKVIQEIQMSIEEHLIYYMNEGINKKEAIAMVAKERQIPKRDVYDVSLKIKK
ncbi:MAG: 16S rRNA (cytidine(1402)-2'-O)-methyltransferase [Clostridia bacterium]|nr:16S rRNA (cytidine(1402)-2'-O)-methyltransferase [Clostridia bacterium]